LLIPYGSEGFGGESVLRPALNRDILGFLPLMIGVRA
jgi:hypothetical protein